MITQTIDYQKYQDAAQKFEHLLLSLGYHPVLIGSVARSYSQKLDHEPKDIDFVLPNSGIKSIRLYRDLWEYRGQTHRVSVIIPKSFLDEALTFPNVIDIDYDFGDGRVAILALEYQPKYQNIEIDLFRSMPNED